MTTICDIEKLVEKELESAKNQHGNYFVSSHEAYAVLLEEYEEAKEEFDRVKHNIDTYWYLVKHDDSSSDKCTALKKIHHDGINLIAEMLQVCAMCNKAMKTELKTERGVENDL
jgi:hypothetical protein